MLKVMSKMGISTVQSYRGAQIFEAIGLNRELDRPLLHLDAVAHRGRRARRDRRASARRATTTRTRSSPSLDGELDVGGQYQWRRRGEFHMYNPETIAKLQHAVRTGNYALFKEYTRAGRRRQPRASRTLRGLLQFKPGKPIPIDEVEPASEIVKRFKTGAMSLGSISREAHENLAIAMNRIGGKSNTGEGGEDPVRFTPDAERRPRAAARSSRWPRAASA